MLVLFHIKAADNGFDACVFINENTYKLEILTNLVIIHIKELPSVGSDLCELTKNT